MNPSTRRVAGAVLVSMLIGAAFAEELLPVTDLVIEKTIPFERTASHNSFLDTGAHFALGAVWFIVHPYLVRIDPMTYEETRLELPGLIGPSRFAAGDGVVWIADTGTNTVFRIDPDAMEVALEFEARMLSARSALGLGDGSLWMVTAENSERVLTRFDAGTGEVEARVDLPGGAAAGVTFGYGSAWVGGSERNEIYRVDPATNTIAATIPVCEQPSFVDLGEGAVFVNCSLLGEFSRIDPAIGKVTSTVETGSKGRVEMDVGGGFVWMATPVKQLIQIDPATGRIVRSYTGLGLHLEPDVSYGGGSLWMVRLRPAGEIYRIKAPS
jgi:virginiamycin B lyase